MATMTPSQLMTLTIPQFGVGGDASPARLFAATMVPFRVVVRNVGGNTVMLAHTSGDLTQLPASAVYMLPPGQSETFVLTPQLGLFGASLGGGGQVSVAASEAIQTKWMES